ncbi:MAG: AmmeMemoRadiSam system protein B [Verrucomicrobiota bacterium]
MNAPEVREARLAGKFYPAPPRRLEQMVKTFLTEGQKVDVSPKAVIAPHAGYIYSGPVAGSAFLPFQPDGKTIRRIVVLGPSHWVGFDGIALPAANSFGTPLGTVTLDLEAIERLRALPFVRVFDAAHDREHSIEVELPFLQQTLEAFKLVPLVVGQAAETEVQQVIDLLWNGPETRFVLSSDLSHYHDYETATRLDRATTDDIEAGRSVNVTQACGHLPISGFLRSAQARGLRARAIDLRNSGDTAGPREEVVGYGAFIFAG